MESSAPTKYRVLLPATSGPAPGAHSGSLPPKRARRRGNSSSVRTSCDVCRKRKTACDGLRPTCMRCSRRNLECVYSPRLTVSAAEKEEIASMRHQIHELKHELQEHNELLSMLVSPSDAIRSIELLARLRSVPNADLSNFLACVRSETSSSEVLMNQNMASLQRARCTISQSTLESELMIRHSNAYPILLPVEAARINLQITMDPTQLLLQNLRREPRKMAALVYSPSIDSEATETARNSPQNVTSGSPSKQLLSPSLCDERLSQLQIDKWTNVDISDSFAASAISLYLETDHPILGLFDVDLFLDDLLSGKKNFCSSLLVNSLLCWACQAYSYFEPAAADLSLRFWDESETLYMQENGVTLLTTVAATQFLSLSASCHGRDPQALLYMREGIAMGKAMGLFGVHGDMSATQWLGDHIDWTRAASQTAWGLFNLVSLHSLHSRTAQIEIPPSLPVPGDQFQGKDGRPEKIPCFIGKTFTAMCHFWSIMHRVLWAYYGTDGSVTPVTRVTFAFAEDAYQQLLHWADNISLGLIRGDGSEHHVIIAHIYLHTAIIDLFRPFLQGEMRFHSMGTFSSNFSNPEAVFLASVDQLKRLLSTYMSKFTSARHCYLWHSALLYVANGMLRKRTLGVDPDWRSWFDLCLSGYRNLSGCFNVSESISKGLLSMAMRNGVETAADAIDTMALIKTLSYQLGDESLTMVVDLDLAARDPLAAQIGILTRQFDERVVLGKPSSDEEDVEFNGDR